MDVEWAEEKLVQYLGVCESVKEATRSGSGWNDTAAEFNRQAELMLAAVERILRIVDPSDTERLRPPSHSYGNNGEMRVRRALGALRDQADIESHLASEAPELVTDQLHPRVWQAAALIWDTAEYRVAVGQAALALSTHIKALSRSKLTDGKLMQDVFSPDPPKQGGVRLQFPGEHDDESWKSRQRGLHLLAQGAYAGIRNVSAHKDEPWEEHQAIEYLAVLSVIARWVDQTDVVTA